MFKNITSILSILVFMFIIEVFCVSLFTLSIPNQIIFTVFDNAEFYINLFVVNPMMAIEVALINNPVFVIQRLDTAQATQAWGVYFMPISILTLFLMSFYINLIIKIKMHRSHWIGLFLSSAIVLFSIFYLRIQTCCTSGPTWLLDIMLFSQANQSFLGLFMWQDIYIHFIKYSTLIQFLTAFIGSIMLYFIHSSASVKKTA